MDQGTEGESGDWTSYVQWNKRSRTSAPETQGQDVNDMGLTYICPGAQATPNASKGPAQSPARQEQPRGQDAGETAAGSWDNYRAGTWSQGSQGSRPSQGRQQEQKMQTIVKDELASHIMIVDTSEDSPTVLPGWKEWVNTVWTKATEPIHILGTPKVERGEVKQFAQMFQPVRFALTKGTKHMDFTGQMFHGWVPSSTFFLLTDTILTNIPRDTVTRIVSTVQYPAAKDQSGDLVPLPHFNAVQVLKVLVLGEDLFFLRINPILRPMDSDINLTDGSKAPAVAWPRKEKW